MSEIPKEQSGSDSSSGAPDRIESLEKELARERQARLAAEAANRMKDEFLSVVSHEMRSPLNAILGWNRILAIKRAQDAEVAAMAARIEQSARTQLKMVNDLLDFGRIGTGKLRITLRPLKLSTLAAMAVEAARPAAEAKGLALALEPGAAGAVVGDPDRLMQVISNLLSNATKFTASGGRVTVRVRERDDHVELSVSDTGQGIDPDLLPRIFERFTQGDSSTTRGTSGLGLGLALAREILALHGGSVGASSEGRDRGSVFTVKLPAAARPDSAARPNAQGEAVRPVDSGKRQLAGLSILVVDDEADARAVVAETFRLEGASVTVGDCVTSALAHLRQDRHFDVVVTDIGMPEEDGYSFVRKLRALPARENLVVVALTGYASRADVEMAIDAGFDLHVAKPVDFDSFVPLIRRLARAAPV